MKKIILSTLAATGLVAGASAQGYINTATIGTSFSVSTSNTLTATVSPIESSSTSPSGYYFEVLTGPFSGGLTDNPLQGWLDTGLSLQNASHAGSITSVSSAQANNWAAGVNNSFMIVGWSASLGTSWSEVSAELASGMWNAEGFFGVSAIGNGLAGAPSPGTPFHLFGSPNASGNPINSGMILGSVSPVPEPATMALGALGGAALLLFRRRK